jgi:hypothetical protein
MAKDRPDIRMSPEEIRAFLATQPRTVVVGVDGKSPVATMGSLKLDGDSLRVAVPEEDPVAGLLAKDDRVCVVVDQFPTYYEIKGVSAHGRAAQQAVDTGWFTFTLALDDVVSFDFSKISVKGTGATAAGT